MKILVCDDSVVFRSQIKKAIASFDDFEVSAVAQNGKVALSKLQSTEIDLMILDLEMPELDGIGTLREMKALNLKTKVIVFSSVTTAGAEKTMRAMEEGAADFVTKPVSERGQSLDAVAEQIKAQLLPKLLQFSKSVLKTPAKKSSTVHTPTTPKESIASPQRKPFLKTNIDLFTPSMLMIGSSTGGPVSLEALLKDLPKPLAIPILIVQHMPPLFTKSLASRLEVISGVTASEARNGEPIRPQIYIAPGDYHMSIFGQDSLSIQLDQGPKICSVRPSVDRLFNSISGTQARKTMAIVLTGMGEDGAEGACTIKNGGGAVLIQDQASSVVWGMPGAVHQLGAFDRMESLTTIRSILLSILERTKRYANVS